jgi:hypothetical protein
VEPGREQADRDRAAMAEPTATQEQREPHQVERDMPAHRISGHSRRPAAATIRRRAAGRRAWRAGRGGPEPQRDTPQRDRADRDEQRRGQRGIGDEADPCARRGVDRKIGGNPALAVADRQQEHLVERGGPGSPGLGQAGEQGAVRVDRGVEIGHLLVAADVVAGEDEAVADPADQQQCRGEEQDVAAGSRAVPLDAAGAASVPGGGTATAKPATKPRS